MCAPTENALRIKLSRLITEIELPANLMRRKLTAILRTITGGYSGTRVRTTRPTSILQKPEVTVLTSSILARQTPVRVLYDPDSWSSACITVTSTCIAETGPYELTSIHISALLPNRESGAEDPDVIVHHDIWRSVL